MRKKENFDSYYDYKYWREIQRSQLGISANLYFLFSSAIFGFILNFLLKEINTLGTCEKCFFIISLIFLILSLSFYCFFTENRLTDYRNTAKLIKEEVDFDEITKLTKDLGEKSWNLYYCQRNLLIIGFISSLIGFSFYIF